MSDINVTVQDEIVNIDVIDTPVLVEVTNSPGPAGAGVAAGGTTGQVLAKASNTNYDTVWVNPSTGGVPYSGATGNVNLGEYELKAGQVTLDTSPTGTAAVGTIRWNDTTGTSETTLKGGNVIIKNGVDLVARVVNKVSPNTTLTKAAYQAVRVSGAQGQRLAIELAQANNDAGSADTIGLVTETIATNQEGFIMTVGQLEGINTTGSLQGETWVDGDVLYLSPTTAGAITNVKPTGATGHLVIIGYVEYAHVNNGKIYVKVMNGWELDELHNVSIVSPANNQGLFYNATSTLWENKSITTALGYTPVPTTRNITINGVTYDLSADRTWTISAGISGSGASGQVTYWTGASAVSGSSTFLWDNTNSRLAIGASTTWQAGIGTLSVVNGTSDAPILSLKNTDASKQVYYASYNDTNKSLQYIVYGSTAPGTIFGQFRANAAVILGYNTPSYLAIGNFENVPLIFGNNNQERFRVTTSGNVSIGTTSDLGVRLGVVGDTLLRGSGNTNATTALTVQNSSSTDILRVRNDGAVLLGAALTYTNVGSRAIFTTADEMRFSRTAAATDTSGSKDFFQMLTSFAPTSGTAQYNFFNINTTVNQTGGANGITRGLYVNPNLTAAADFRAIETTAGNVLFGASGTGFFWDNANGRLGIGTNAPAEELTVVGTIRSNAKTGADNVFLEGYNSAGTFIAQLKEASSGGFGGLQFNGQRNDATGGAGIFFNSFVGTTASGNNAAVQFNANGGIITSPTDLPTGIPIAIFSKRSGGVIVNQMALFQTGNLLLQNGGTFTDGGQRLQVIGDTLLRGSGATSSTTALTVQNSSSTNLFTVRNDGNVGIGTASPVSRLHINSTGTLANFGTASNNGVVISTNGSGTGLITAWNYDVAAPSSTTIAASAVLGFNGSPTNFYGVGVGEVRSLNYDIWFQTGATNGGGYRFYKGVTEMFTIYTNGNVGIGTGATTTTSLLNLSASTSTKAHINLASGSAPSSPANGDIWFDGTDIKMRIGGVTKTFTLV